MKIKTKLLIWKKIFKLGRHGSTHLESALGRQKQENNCEFKPSLVYIEDLSEKGTMKGRGGDKEGTKEGRKEGKEREGNVVV